MVQTQVNLSEKADKNVLIFMAHHYLKDKRDAINTMLEEYKPSK